MVHKMGEDLIREKVLPFTQLGRLIRPEEIADAICFMISNSAVSGELWADAGYARRCKSIQAWQPRVHRPKSPPRPSARWPHYRR